MTAPVYLTLKMWIKRLLKMHGCTVLVIPKPICRTLQLRPGDYVQTDLSATQAGAYFVKLNPQEKPDVTDPRNPARTD